MFSTSDYADNTFNRLFPTFVKGRGRLLPVEGINPETPLIDIDKDPTDHPADANSSNYGVKGILCSNTNQDTPQNQEEE